MKLDVDAVMRYYSVIKNDEYFMKEAIKEAKKALLIDEVPIGCVIVKDNKIISRGYNKRESKQNSLAHAEVIAINKACKKLGTWRLEDCTMYITLEPCIMCGGDIIQSRIPNVIYSAYDYRFGVNKSLINIFELKFNHTVNIKGGLLEEETSKMISDFFKKLRSS